jgi:hypothetical protein
MNRWLRLKTFMQPLGTTCVAPTNLTNETVMITSICWGILGLVHVIPALALFRPALLTRLYGVAEGTDTFLLLHHRAALFLGIAIVCLWSVARSEVRPLASVVVAVSMLSFVALYWFAGSPPAFRTIALVDLAAVPVLLFAAWQAFRG